MIDSTRFFDFIFSFVGLIVLSPVFLICILLIKLTSKGSAFFVQKRVGKNGVEFNMYKFRSMLVRTHEDSLLTVGEKDNRITKIGWLLRKYKLDELPQFYNVLINDMSFVGPRPEVKKYTDLYSEEQRKILSVKPGITDFASIEFKNENELLATASNPEEFYIEEIIPRKIKLNMIYIENKTISNYFKILFNTAF